jgi:hypothetical protein
LQLLPDRDRPDPGIPLIDSARATPKFKMSCPSTWVDGRRQTVDELSYDFNPAPTAAGKKAAKFTDPHPVASL